MVSAHLFLCVPSVFPFFLCVPSVCQSFLCVPSVCSIFPVCSICVSVLPVCPSWLFFKSVWVSIIPLFYLYVHHFCVFHLCVYLNCVLSVCVSIFPVCRVSFTPDSLKQVVQKFQLSDRALDHSGELVATVLPSMLDVLERGLGDRITLMQPQPHPSPMVCVFCFFVKWLSYTPLPWFVSSTSLCSDSATPLSHGLRLLILCVVIHGLRLLILCVVIQPHPSPMVCVFWSFV